MTDPTQPAARPGSTLVCKRQWYPILSKLSNRTNKIERRPQLEAPLYRLGSAHIRLWLPTGGRQGCIPNHPLCERRDPALKAANRQGVLPNQPPLVPGRVIETRDVAVTIGFLGYRTGTPLGQVRRRWNGRRGDPPATTTRITDPERRAYIERASKLPARDAVALPRTKQIHHWRHSYL